MKSPDVLLFGPYKIDREQRLLMKGNSITPLAPKIFDLLLALAESGGRVMEKKVLLDRLWPDTFVEEGSLTRNISALRKVLGENSHDQRYISTVPRRGYRFVAQVYAETAAGSLEAGSADRGAPSAGEKHVTEQVSGNRHVPHQEASQEAYDCYLRGRFYARRQNKEDNEKARLALERAIVLNPTFAVAYAELAQTYIWRLFLFSPHELQWEEKAFVAVEKALALDPDLAVAYVARGRLLWTPANRFPHVRAVREYRRALALDPNLDEARNQLALVYCHVGYFEEALQESQKALSGNPNNHLAVYRIAETLAFQLKYDQALKVLRTIPPDVNPSLIGYQTAWVLYNLGNSKEALAMIERLLKDYPDDDGALFVSMQAILAASAGEERKAKSKIREAIRTGEGFGHFHHSAYHIAIAFAQMNQAEQAVEWLDAAAGNGFPCYPLFETDANLDTIRRGSRFIDFMTRLRQQWIGYQEMF